MKKTSGIYIIRNVITNSVYVGSAAHLQKRWQEHFSKLRNNVHANAIMQNAWNKYGEIAFEFSVIEDIIDKSLLISREQFWIDSYRSSHTSYNICPTAGNSAGRIVSEATRQKLSIAQKGIPKWDEEGRKQLSAIKKGKKFNEEAKKNMSDSRIGKPRSDAFKRVISEIQKGRPHDDARKSAISVGLKQYHATLREKGEK